MIDILINEYFAAKAQILAGKMRVAEMSVRERAGLLLTVTSSDVKEAIEHGKEMVAQVKAVTGYDYFQVQQWTQAIELLERL